MRKVPRMPALLQIEYAADQFLPNDHIGTIARARVALAMARARPPTANCMLYRHTGMRSLN
ncbi:hypothetical protein PXO_05803 [Xanthomonas oryzae pv. oryzae PXO99A]|uniref:Uncharacterized protein n=1 Tax=Xanthomonas oryzae pv. oryzae (strain PXO99A) TaxID=360094 RepID=A0A0K0GF59_XANOP|nr:hypothetical protein PXO_05803 [Xanthomonas oryzae pv. oryzae PXO99A]